MAGISNFERIPRELKDREQWLCWQYADQGGPKPTKVPLQSRSGREASVTKPEHWSTFREATEAAPNVNGIGFVFTENDSYLGVDLDDAGGKPNIFENQLRIFHKLNSYSELSPSGKGLHIIVKAKLPGSGRRRDFVEMYDRGRYFTMTGNVHLNTPIADRFVPILEEYEKLGAPPKPSVYVENCPQYKSDDEVIAIARAAANGDLFNVLWRGEWQTLYLSQSEADIAIIDIIGYYTQNINQIERIFWCSELGKRPKARRRDYVRGMIRKAFDNQLPQVDVEGFQIQIDKLNDTRREKEKAAALTVTGGSQSAAASFRPCEEAGVTGRGTTDNKFVLRPGFVPMSSLPKGLLGEIATFFYEAAACPVREIALAGAIGLMAGIAGRCFNVSGSGLNQYMIVIAGTGRGKEAISSGIAKLLSAVKITCPALMDFRGPDEIQSAQALLKWLANAPCIFSIAGEFGHRFAQMVAHKGHPHMVQLKRTLLELYGKNTKGNTLGAMAYSDKDKNTIPVDNPSLTIIGESVPVRFYEHVSEDVILDGLLPRFMIIEYTGKREYFNEYSHIAVPSSSLIENFRAFAARCIDLNTRHAIHNIPLDQDATELFRAFDRWTTDEINNPKHSLVAHELWSRANAKARRLAGLYAVSENHILPTLTLVHARAAIDEIVFQTQDLIGKFDRYEIGGGSVEAPPHESKQLGMMTRIIGEMIFKPYDQCAEKYKVPPDLWEKKIIPYASLNGRLTNQNCFRHDRRGSGEAIKRTYMQLVDAGSVEEIRKDAMEQIHKRKCRAFAIKDPARFLEAFERSRGD